MRLECVQNGQSFKNRLKIAVGRVALGEVPDLVRIVLYRPRFWGRPMGLFSDSVLRKPSEWTVGERELFAAYVSGKNSCRFCFDAHTAVTERAFGHPVVDLVMADVGTAPISEPARAILPFVEKLTLEPENVGPADIEALRAAGLSDEAILDAIYVCAAFAIYNRVVFALGVEPMNPRQLQGISLMLLKVGYDF
jgi:uncharacterized peroxidase-related enzyme